MKKYFSKTTILSLLTLATILFVRQYVFFTVVILSSVSFIMISLSSERKKDLKLFLFGFIFVPLSETLVIYYGGWSYNTSDLHLFNFSYYLPLIWGIACLSIKSMTFKIYGLK